MFTGGNRWQERNEHYQGQEVLGDMGQKSDQPLPRSRRLRRILWLQLHVAIYRPDSFVLMLRYCANLKTIRYESTSLKRILANKLRV